MMSEGRSCYSLNTALAGSFIEILIGDIIEGPNKTYSTEISTKSFSLKQFSYQPFSNNYRKLHKNRNGTAVNFTRFKDHIF